MAALIYEESHRFPHPSGDDDDGGFGGTDDGKSGTITITEAVMTEIATTTTVFTSKVRI